MKLIHLFKRIFKHRNIKEPWLEYYQEKDRTIKFTNHTIYHYLKHIVGADTELTALNYFGHKITYDELFKSINRVSNSLITLGVKPKDVVTICTPNIPEAIVAFYAINKIGAIVDMIHPLSSNTEIKRYLTESKSRILFLVDFNYSKIQTILKETHVYKTIIIPVSNSMPLLTSTVYELTKNFKIKKNYSFKDEYISWLDFINMGPNNRDFIEPKISSKDAALILHSGGTTGTPKGILISNYSFNAEAQQGAINVKNMLPQDKIVTILPIFHGFGLGVCLHCPLCLKVEVILVPEFNAKRFAKILKKEKPQVLAGVPTLWESITKNHNFKKIDLSCLKYVISGGDFLSLQLEEAMNQFLKKHRANIKITKGYGMTESVAATAFTFDGTNEPGSIGIPMIGNRFCICKPHTTVELSCGQIGEICVNGPTIMMKYLNNKKETRNVLKKHNDGKIWLHTGDLGYINKNGVIYFTHRLKRIIVSSGFNLYPSEIENIILTHPKVLKCCVIPISHPYKIHVAKALIILKENEKITSNIKQEIKLLCEKNLAKYSWPKAYEFVSEFPTTLYGKIDYKELENHDKNKRTSL